MKHAPPAPPELGSRDGLSYALFLPEGEPAVGVVQLHGAGSAKENHFDFGRLCREQGQACVCMDSRGHGRSEGEFGPDAVDDVLAMCAFVREHAPTVAIRGSSLGGFLAIQAAAASSEIAGVIAICPAGEDHLAGGLRSGNFEMRVGDPVALEAWLLAQDIGDAVERIAPRPLLLMHAEGDTQIPSDHSEELYERAGEPRKLVIAPGGAHQTAQHDPELQGVALRWLERELAAREPNT